MPDVVIDAHGGLTVDELKTRGLTADELKVELKRGLTVDEPKAELKKGLKARGLPVDELTVDLKRELTVDPYVDVPDVVIDAHGGPTVDELKAMGLTADELKVELKRGLTVDELKMELKRGLKTDERAGDTLKVDRKKEVNKAVLKVELESNVHRASAPGISPGRAQGVTSTNFENGVQGLTTELDMELEDSSGGSSRATRTGQRAQGSPPGRAQGELRWCNFEARVQGAYAGARD